MSTLSILGKQLTPVITSPLVVTASVVGVLVLWNLYSYITSPLRKFPGPFLAGWTNLWRLYHASSGKYQWTIEALHEKYGPVVRIGPNLLDLDYPEMIKTVYGTDGKWRKTEFYHNSSAYIDGKLTYHLFSTTDQPAHARMKRPIVKYYSMSSVLAMEPHVNRVLGDLCTHLEMRFMDKAGQPSSDCDLGRWIAYYTWDFISAATFSKRFGYMDAGHDFDGTIHIADQVTDYMAAVGQMPWLDFVFDKNPIKRIGPPNLQNVTRISYENMVKRIAEGDEKADAKTAEEKDFLDHFLDAKRKVPDVVDTNVVMGYLQVNMLAGADTTAITLRAIFHFLISNPRTLARLEEEVLGANLPLVDGVVTFAAARALPYLDAVVREAMRMHPGVGLLLERYVPTEGVTLPDGSFLPPGTGVGLNPYIIGRNKSVWGEDSAEFRPERWLRRDGEDEAAFQQRLRHMNASDLTFGGGSRICIGRHVAMLETYKVVATLIQRYQILPAQVPQDFEIVSTWFPRQSGLVCRLAKRDV
ncbi:hypothetical protein SBRCBS47491_004554 [Sporothrix bragantina]|uniref:Uncharacterized protein n=1 Tax=Sporothrix bragantina TaxID=671064 RepID=A0ABP0BPI3_9PEZI